MSKQWELNQEAFESLLSWLGSDREEAGRKYEEIRHSLINIFTWRGVSEAEELADETINRVARKVPELSESYVGEPALYFYGVSKKVLLEYQRRKPPVSLDDQYLAATPPEEEDTSEREQACLERCLQKLSPNSRELILGYYRVVQQTKLEDYRKNMARQQGVSLNNLRVRVHRIRAALQQCIRSCLGTDATKGSM
jgi:RNA polymerase sigma factor (sigma-70 family)